MLTTCKGSPHPLSHVLAYDQLFPIHYAFTTTISAIKEPSSFVQAINDPKWCLARDEEICALYENCTWYF